QTLQLVRIAKMFGFSQDDFGEVMGGTKIPEIIENIESKRFILATPDKLVTLLNAYERTRHGAAITILRRFNFVFDEIHVYNSLMLTSLKYFIRSVREFRPDMRGFYFLSATFPERTWQILKEELGMSEKDRIEGKSFAGEIELAIEPEKTSCKAAKHIAEIIRDLGMTDHSIMIFNTALRAWELSQEVGGNLFVGQDKMSEARREKNFAIYEQNYKCDRPNNILCGSPAIEAGVDFKAKNLVIEESYADSFAQRFGRAGRAGRPCKVLVFSNTLYQLAEDGMLQPQHSRQDFLKLIETHCQQREPTAIFNSLAAYAYYKFWRKEQRIFDPEDLEIMEKLDQKGVDYSPFRGFVPYTEYEIGGQKISFKSLFKKDLPVLPNGKVKGAPSPERYFFANRRPPVYAVYKIQSTPLPPEILAEDDKGKRRVSLCKVKFDLFSQWFWTVLDIDLLDADEESSKGDDNITLQLSDNYRVGGDAPGRVRFFEVDA
ncbi:MAG TPA: hypothetical protein EYP53_02180, partial [Candidatus Latescibacteria bacterium]|nr:hypothetical protein [Candidatus Latescibacterota bacterium]